MTFKVVIPARHASQRLPGKALLDVGGLPLVVRVLRRAQRSGAEEVIVATDHAPIAQAVRAAGGRALMTDADHASGTDRVAEVAERLGWGDDTAVVNVQGDEPLMPPALIDQCAALLQERIADIATLAWPVADDDEFQRPDVVKVVCAADGTALYFSRAPIPFPREPAAAVGGPALRHIGLYAYRVAALRAWSSAAPAPIEEREKLEQLRALWLGLRIRVGEAQVLPGPGVDTPADLARVRALIAKEEG